MPNLNERAVVGKATSLVVELVEQARRKDERADWLLEDAEACEAEGPPEDAEWSEQIVWCIRTGYDPGYADRLRREAATLKADAAALRDAARMVVRGDIDGAMAASRRIADVAERDAVLAKTGGLGAELHAERADAAYARARMFADCAQQIHAMKAQARRPMSGWRRTCARAPRQRRAIRTAARRPSRVDRDDGDGPPGGPEPPSHSAAPLAVWGAS